MSTQNINIAITVNGANPAARQIASVGNAARQAHGSVFNLRNLLLGFTVKALASEFIRFSDAATRIDNRLNVLTGSVGRSNELFNALFKVAQDTRSELEPTIDSYARLERATIGLNLTGQQLVDLTKGINQSFQIFGNTSKEAAAAMTQFSQGLSVGVLRGDELRSVLEQAPRLAKAIADGLNEIPEGQGLSEKFGRLFRDFETGAISSEILAGGLRELGKSGKLTSEIISKALLTQLEKLDDEFRRTTPTIENGFTLIENKMIQLARSPEFRAFSAEFGKALVFIADNLDEVFAAIAPIAVAIVQLFPLIGELAGIFWELAMTASNAFQDFVKTLGGLFGIASSETGSFAQDFVKFWMGAISAVYKVFKDFVSFFIRGAAAIGGFMGAVVRDIVYGFTAAFDAISLAAEGLVNFLIDGVNVFKSEQDKIAKVDWSEARNTIKEDFINPLEAAQMAADNAAATFDGMLKPLEVAAYKTGDAVFRYVQRTEEAIKNLGKTTNQEITNTLGKIAGDKEALPAAIQLSANDQRRLDSFTQNMEELRDGSDDAQKALQTLNRVVKQYNALAGNEEIGSFLPNRIKFEKEIAELRQRYSNEAVQQLKDEHIALGEAAQSSLDHYKAQRLLNEALKNGIPATQAQVDALAEVLKNERMVLDVQRERDNLLDSLTRKADQYRSVLEATNQLVASGNMTESQAKREIDKTEVGQGVRAAKDFVAENDVDPNAKVNREIELLQEERDMRAEFLNTAATEDLENATAYEELRLEMIETYARKETEIRMAAQALQYENASVAFGDLADLTKGFVKESSGLYKTLFAISKGFAIADGFVKLNQAIMNASVSLPFPANLAAMAQVASSGLALLTTIKGAAAPDTALKDGGWVSGPGGPRDDAVRAALSNGEYVVNAEAAGRNAQLLEAINSGRYNSGQKEGMTLNLTQNINGVQDADSFRASGRQVAADTARAVDRASRRNA